MQFLLKTILAELLEREFRSYIISESETWGGCTVAAEPCQGTAAGPWPSGCCPRTPTQCSSTGHHPGGCLHQTQGKQGVAGFRRELAVGEMEA
jgi:hypothetical protein